VDELGKAWIRAKGIDRGKHREPEQFVISEPVGRFQPIKSSIGVAEARMDYHEGDRRSMTLSKKLIEFAEKALGFIPPAKPAVDMPQEGEREGFARKAKSLLKRGNSFLTPALAPCRPPEHEMCVKGIRE
jgi:hypothetical protein